MIGTNGNHQEYDFVFGVPEVTFEDNPHVLLSTMSPIPINASVTIPGTEFEVHKILVRGDYVDLALPSTVYIIGTGVQRDKTVVVKASGKVSVHVMANEGKSGDGFLVLPTRQLGTDHYVLAYRPLLGPNDRSFICVSALEGETSIRIKSNTGHIHNTDIVLGRYESHQQLREAGIDLSGTQILSDHPITVIAGTQCSSVGGGSCDALVESMPPVKIWGTRVVLSPFAGKDNGYMYRVLGTNVTTAATISNVGTVTLTEGQWYENDTTDDTIVMIESNYPILVMQFIKGGGSSMPRADSSMILAPSTNMYSNSVTFPVFDVSVSTNNYYVHVITEYRQVNGLKFDNLSMASWEKLVAPYGEMCSVRGSVTAGAVHTISHDDGNVRFTAAVYGLVLFVGSSHPGSYAYCAGIEDIGRYFVSFITL